MAPGCTTTQHQQNKSKTFSLEQINKCELSNSENTNLLDENNYIVRYDEIYLDQIPLPSTPPPQVATIQIETINKAKQDNTLLFSDTIDSFEILEQTIMKQKRIAKMKNNDLRLKVLLKRTFNLVCEIMDHENGFDSDEQSIDEPAEEVEQKIQEQTDEVDCEDQPLTQNELNQLDFQNITLKQYNFYELDNTIINEQELNDKQSEHYISLEPIMTYIEQQSISNKRKLSDDLDSDCYAKRYKLNRSLSSSDDENEDEFKSKYQLETNSFHLFNNLTNDFKIKNKSSTKCDLFNTSSSDTAYSLKISSINFYA